MAKRSVNRSNQTGRFIRLLFTELSNSDSFLATLLTTTSLLGVLVTGLIFAKNILPTNFLKSLFEQEKAKETLTLFITLLTVMVTIVPFLVKYLSKDISISSNKKTGELNDDISGLERIVRFRHKALINESIDKILTSDNAAERIQEAIIKQSTSKIEQSILDKLSNQFKPSSEQKAKADFLELEANKVIIDTKAYIVKLQRNSVINLVIGILWSVTGVIFLVNLTLSNSRFTDLSDFMMYFIPRISGVIFFQIFGFFFLRLYKSNLEDSKYFQNELTNLNSKLFSIKVSSVLQRDIILDEALRNLILSERNFKLLKDESLLTLEKSKIENDIDTKIFNSFREYWGKYNLPESKKSE